MFNILLVGNGFDLAHGLCTKYNHFLFIMKNWKDFYSNYLSAKSGDMCNEDSEFYMFLNNVQKLDEENLNALGMIIENNSWVRYFCNCDAEIDGWIDFEKEVYPVIELFETIFRASYKMSRNRIGDNIYGKAIMGRTQFSTKNLQVANLWRKYIGLIGNDAIYIKEDYASMRFGILKKKIMQSLREEFDEFVRAFEIYLTEFVIKTELQPLKQISALDAKCVISFNYTLTEKLYGVEEQDVHHIHGRVRNDIRVGTNNMVLGVNEREQQNLDFIYFIKYFQRIQKASGVKYKEFLDRAYENNYLSSDKYHLHIYGHSLDETDEDILKYVIGNVTPSGRLALKPRQVIIYYYDQTDFEQKVINLIKLYGREIVEENMENGSILFVRINNEIEDV